MMLKVVLILALSLVTVHGKPPRARPKERRQRTKRKSRLLDRKRSNKSPFDHSPKGKNVHIHEDPMDLSGSFDFNSDSLNNGQVGSIGEFHVPESPVSERPSTVDEYSIFVRVCTQILKLKNDVFQMDVRSDWTVGQVIQTLLARAELPVVGIWELRFRHDITGSYRTLAEEMTLAECGIDANNADFWDNALVLVEHFWDIESLEEKQPIFRVKHQNPTLKNQELFLQYVRRSEAKHYPFKGTLFAYFRIVAQVAGGGEFFRFLPSKVPVSYDAAQLVPGLSEQQMWMAYFGSKCKSAFSLPVGFIRDGYGDGMPPDRDILFIYFDNELFNPADNRVVFMETITGSNAVGDLRGMERDDFFKAGSPVHHDAYADPEENIKERLWAKGLPISGPDTTEGFLTLISDLPDPQDCLQRLTVAGFTQWEDLRGIKYEELIGEHVELQPEQATKIRRYLTEIDVSPIVWSWEALNEWEAIFQANVEPQGTGGKPSETFRGYKLLDPSALLSDLDVSTGAEVGDSNSLPAIFWSRDALDSLNPIFEAEIRIDSGEDQGQTKTVHIQWSSISSQQFEDTPFENSFFWIDVLPIQMTVMCQTSKGKWVRYSEQFDLKEQRNVFDYLENAHINIIRSGSKGDKYISVDMTKHVYEKYGQRQIDDLSYAELEGVVPSGMDTVEWSVTLKSVVEPQETTLEKFMSTQKAFTLKQILRRLGMMHFEQVLAEEEYEIAILSQGWIFDLENVS